MPSWLHSGVSWMPGRLALDTAIIETFNAYRREWRHLLPRALATYIPGGLIVLIVRQLTNELIAGYAEELVLIAGLFTLQAIEISHAAAVREGGEPEPFFVAWQHVRPRSAVLLRAFGLLILRLLVPLVVGSFLLVAVTVATANCSDPFAPCTINYPVYWVSFIAFFVLVVLLCVRWSLWVPAIVLEGCGARAGIRRSVELTRHNRTRLAAWLIAGSLLGSLVWLLLHTIFNAMLGSAPAVADFFANAIGDTIAGSFLVILLTEMYFRLRGGTATAPPPPPPPT